MNAPAAPDRPATTSGREGAPVVGDGATDRPEPGRNDTWGVANLVVRYGSRVALRGVSLEIPAGAVTTVVGADGAGKSSLLRALAGAVRPESGEVHRPDRRQLGYVAGDRAVYRDLTTVENLSFAGEAYGLHGGELAGRIEAMLRRIGLTGAGGRLAERLSGGMRQKLAVAMAMLHDPALLILDEPTTGVDPVSRVELWELIAEAAASGTAVALATSYLDEAERAARVLVLAEGRQLAAGTSEEIVAAMPGSLWSVGSAMGTASWRRGSSWRIWVGDGAAAPTITSRAERVTPDLEDALVVAEIAAEGARIAPPVVTPPVVTPPVVTPPVVTPPARSDPSMPRPDADPLMQVSGIGQRFGRLQALDGVDLEVKPGEVVGLIGANGSGKTTLIRVALGLLRPTSGRAYLFGDVPSRQTRGRVGYMPQRLGLYEDLTVGENLAFVERVFGVADPPPIDPELEAARERLVGDLPLGMRRRIAFAAMMSHRPDLLILDEPTSGVGALGRTRLWQLIRDAAESGSGILVTTHYMSEVSQCDRLVLLLSGRVAAVGTAAEIVGDLRTTEVIAEPWNRAFRVLRDAGLPVVLAGRRVRIPGADAATVQRALDAAGLAAELRSSPATFEEAFVLLARRAGDAAGFPGRDAA